MVVERGILHDHTAVPEFIDQIFAKQAQKSSFSTIENERFGLVFTKPGSINSGIGGGKR
jgi:hypothetical protein